MPVTTRQRKSAQQLDTLGETGSNHSASDLPPPRERKGLRPVSKPLSNTRLTNLIYILAITSLLFGGFYAWRITQWKAEAGGWWNLALGKKPPQYQAAQTGRQPIQSGSSKQGSPLEDKVVDLADAFGIKPTDLASALKSIFDQQVAPATMASISSSAVKSGQTGEAVQIIIGGFEGDAQATGVLGSVTDTFGKVVGMDEMPELDD